MRESSKEGLEVRERERRGRGRAKRRGSNEKRKKNPPSPVRQDLLDRLDVLDGGERVAGLGDLEPGLGVGLRGLDGADEHRALEGARGGRAGGGGG